MRAKKFGGVSKTLAATSLVLLSLTSMFAVNAQLPEDYVSVVRSTTETTTSEGLLLEAAPSYAQFTGRDGLQLALSMP